MTFRPSLTYILNHLFGWLLFSPLLLIFAILDVAWRLPRQYGIWVGPYPCASLCGVHLKSTQRRPGKSRHPRVRVQGLGLTLAIRRIIIYRRKIWTNYPWNERRLLSIDRCLGPLVDSNVNDHVGIKGETLESLEY